MVLQNKTETDLCEQTEPMALASDDREEKFQTSLKSFEDRLRKKIVQKGGPFVPREELEEWYIDIKEIFLDLVGQRDELEPRKRLEELMQQMFDKIKSENALAQEELIQKSQKGAMEKFKNSVETITPVYGTKKEDFDALVATEIDVCLEEFKSHLGNAPVSAINHHAESVRRDLAQARDHQWNQLETKKNEVESKFQEKVDAAVHVYHENMKLLTSDEIPSSEQLEKANKKCAVLAFKNFDVLAKNSHEENVYTEFRNRLKASLKNELKFYEQLRADSLKQFVTDMEASIDDAIATFDDEARQIIEGAYSAGDKLQIEELYTQIKEFCMQALDEVECPDNGLTREYKSLFVERLNVNRENALASLKEQERRHVDSEQFLRSSMQEMTNTLEILLDFRRAIDEYKLEEELSHAVGGISENLRSKLHGVGMQDITMYLNELSAFALKEQRRITAQNLELQREMERVSKEKLENYSQLYVGRMEDKQTTVSSLQEFESAHRTVTSRLCEELSLELQEVSDAASINRLTKSLQDRLDSQFDVLRSNFIVENSKRMTANFREFASIVEVDYAKHVEDNPLPEDAENNVEICNKLESYRRDCSTEVSRVYSQDSVPHSTAMEQVEKYTKELEMTLKTKAREAAGDEKAKLVGTGIKLVKELLEAKRENLEKSSNMEEVDEIFSRVRSEVEAKFSSMSTTSEKEDKENALNDITNYMDEEFQRISQAIAAKLEQQETFLDDLMKDSVKSIGNSIEEFLEQKKFYEKAALDRLLQSHHDARKNFEDILNTNGIVLTDRIEDSWKEKVQDRIDSIHAKNTANEELAFKKLVPLLAKWYGSINASTHEDFRLREENVKLKAENFLKEFNTDRLEDSPTIMNRLANLSLEFRNKALNSLEKEFARKFSAVCETAERKYRNSMDELIGTNNLPLNPKDLQMFHDHSSSVALRKLQQEGSIAASGKGKIQAYLEMVYKRYEERNLLKSAEDTNAVVGIDLGTTTSSVAIYKHGEVRVIKDQAGRNLNPSYVYFPESGDPVVGHEAKSEAHMHNPADTIYDAKRLIGRDFDDPHVQNDAKNKWPFRVTRGANGRPQIAVKGKRYEPEEISAHILRKMKAIAESDLGHDVSKAVITVPANFDDRQRGATKQAAQLAGLEVLQIINEPTAAAMAHALNWKEVRKTILVFDFGGGTLDVSIVRTEEAEGANDASRPSTSKAVRRGGNGGCMRLRLDVLTTAGDTHLGGEDLDDLLVEYCARKFREEHGIELLQPEPDKPNSLLGVNKRRRRLRTACEEAKCRLTSINSATINVDSIYREKNLLVTVTRQEFEQMSEDLLTKAIEVVGKALEEAHLQKQDIDEVLMVGGSSRIPRVKVLLQEFLEIRAIFLNQRIDIQEAVAQGAAIQACILSGGKAAVDLPKVKDVQPFSLGIEIIGGDMSVIIPRNSRIPFKALRKYETTEANQREVMITVYSGEEEIANDNVLLGQFRLLRIPPGPRGSQVIDVEMKIDTSGILNVKATCVSNGVNKNIVIEEHRGRLSDFQMQHLRESLVN